MFIATHTHPTMGPEGRRMKRNELIPFCLVILPRHDPCIARELAFVGPYRYSINGQGFFSVYLPPKASPVFE